MNIKEFITNRNISYYQQAYHITEIESNPSEFIKKYLAKGDKENHLSNYFLHCPDSEHRILHTMSIYLLGIILYDSSHTLKTYIDSVTNDNLQADNYSEFLYWWFQICFIHDIGYPLFEITNGRLPFKMWSTKKNDLVKEKISFELSARSQEPKGFIPAKLISCFPFYSKYRTDKSNEFIDHGFFAGIYYF